MFHRAKGGIAAAFLVTGSLCLHAGCEDDPDLEELAALGEGCLLDSDCDAPLVCVFRRCHYQCETTPDCHDTYGLDPLVNCVTGDKPTNVCQLDSEISCEVEGIDGLLASSRCPGEQVCGVDGTCRDRCVSSADCVAGDTCVQGTCVYESELNEDGLLTDPDDKTEAGAPCSYTSECVTPLVCLAQVCREACKETVDCPDGKVCVLEGSGYHTCQSPTSPEEPLTCGNEERDGDETDVDCGGSCLPCGPGSPCEGPADCTSTLCDAGLCATPACDDGVKNGTETGEDCGGVCAPCPPSASCEQPNDCTTGLCVRGICYEEGCGNELVDGDETDVDCGGTCPGCETGATCYESGDCADFVCDDFACVQGDCADGLKNNDEKAVDCGGPCAVGCGLGAPCDDLTDCLSESCAAVSQVCIAPSCNDSQQNGSETGVDCGGSCGPCGLGEGCDNDGDCLAPSAGCHPITLVCSAKHTVTVVKSGSGAGTVSSTPAGLISCGGICSATLFEGSQLSLQVTPAGSSTFDGWAQGCAGPSCELTVTGDVTVEAQLSSPLGSWQSQFVMYNASSSRALAVGADHAAYVGGVTDYPVRSRRRPARQDLDQPRNGRVHRQVQLGRELRVGLQLRELRRPFDVPRDPGPRPQRDGGARRSLPDWRSAPAERRVPPALQPGGIALARLSTTNGVVQNAACPGAGATPTDIAIASDGDIVVVGRFTDSVNVGGGALAVPGTHAFIARYDGASLAFVQGGMLGDGGMRDATRIAVGPGGAFVVAGACAGDVDFGGGVVSDNPQGNGTTDDLCVVKLSAALVPQWVYQRGDNAADTAVAADFPPEWGT
jgi:hypothetical protein